MRNSNPLKNIVHFGWVWAAFAVAVSLSAPGLAGEVESWKPAPPMPDDFDWVQMTSGEWLKGEIIAMYNESLEFDSEEFDAQSLGWSDLQQIRSARVCQVRFLDETIATGKILLEGDTIRVIGEQVLEHNRSQVLSITPGEPRERNYWAGKISAGLNIRTGNSEQTDFSAKATLIRRTPQSRINIDYLGNFSETNNISPDDDQRQKVSIADDQRLNANWDRFISDRFYLTPLYGEIYRDPIQNIINRFTVGVGLGYTLIDTSKVDWDVNAGVAYQNTEYNDVQAGEDETYSSPAVGIGTKYQNEIAKWLDFHLNYNFYIVSEETGSFTHHLLTGLEFDLIGDFGFDVDWVWDFTKDPRPDSDGSVPEQSDFRMMVSLGYSF